MLLLAKQVYGAAVEASDGKIGKLCDFVFDDQHWKIRELVLDAGTWLNRRRVTLPPDMICHRDWADHRLVVTGLTRQQVIESPGSETHVPLGGQAALEAATIVDWELFWLNTLDHPWQVSSDPHLRNTQEITGYHIQGTDRGVGHVADFIIDDESWTIHNLIVDTRNWWPGKHVRLVPSWVEGIDGKSRTLHVRLSRDTIEHSRLYEGTASLELQHVGPPHSP